MPTWLAPIAMSLAQRQQQQEAEQKTRRNAMAGISAQQSQALGYPQYGVQAAKFNQQMEDEDQGQNWMAALGPILSRRM